MGESVKDRVCGTEVRSGEFSAVYLGAEYRFCSVECRDRFMAFPHLYAGLRSQQSPRQRGLQVLSRRRLRLTVPVPLSAEQGARVTEVLEALPGVRAVEVCGNYIEMVCDPLQVQAASIEARLVDVGELLGEGWVERLREGLKHCAEQSEATSATLGPSI
jgi:YHS domain-containing protein